MDDPRIHEHWDSGPLYLMDSRKVEQRHAAACPLLYGSDQGFSSGGMARRPTTGGTEQQECLPSTGMDVAETGSTPLECTGTDLGVTGVTDTPRQRTETAAAAATALAGCDPKPAVAFISDYTTMELFQQATTATQAECHPCKAVSAVPICPPPAGLDYVHQSQFDMSQPSRDGSHETGSEQTSVLWSQLFLANSKLLDKARGRWQG